MSRQEHKAVFTADNSDLKKKSNEVSGSFDKIKNQAKILGAALAAAFSVGVIVNFLKKSAQAYDEEAKAAQSLLTALKGREDIQKNIIKQATELQRKTLFGDEQTIQAGARLAMILGQDEQAIKRLLPLVQDLAQGKNMDLASAADLVAKSVGSSTNSLARYGIQIEGTVGSSQRLESAVKELNRQVGGQAEAAAKIGLGPLAQLKNAYGDLMEIVGKAVLESKQFNKNINDLKEVAEGTTDFINTDFVTSQGKAITGFRKLVLWIGLATGKQRALETVIKSGVYQQEHATETTVESTEVVKAHVKTIADYRAEIKELEESLDSLTVGQGAQAEGIKNQIKQIQSLIDKTLEYKTEIKGPSITSEMPMMGGMMMDPNAAAELAEINTWVEKQLEGVTAAYTSAEAAAVAFSEEVLQSSASGAKGLKEFARVAVETARKYIAAELASAVATQVKKALVNVPFPFNIIAAGVAGGAAAALFNSLVPKFAAGGAAFGPMLAMVGEAPGISRTNPEYVGTAAQLGKMGIGGGGGTLTARVSRGDLLFILNEGESFNQKNY